MGTVSRHFYLRVRVPIASGLAEIDIAFYQIVVCADINRRKLICTATAGLGIALSGCAESEDSSETNENGGGDSSDTNQAEDNEREVTAMLQTSRGDIQVELYSERAPRTVENFVGLATGEKVWTDPETGEQVDGEPLYKDVAFHRVIEDFIIQSGDPTETGFGGPGYEFDDEFHPDLRHDQAGILSMANSGSDTNGSQFFITLAPQPHLDDKHSVFGSVVDGMDTVNEIGSVETDDNDRPVEDVILESVSIVGR